MSAKLKQIYDLVKQLFDTVVLKKDVIDSVTDIFREYTERLTSAQQDPEVMTGAEQYAIDKADEFSHEVWGAFSPSNVDKIMADQDTCQKMCDFYQEIVSARYELFGLIYHAQVYKYNKTTPRANASAYELLDDLTAYQQLVDKHHVPVSTADKNDCDRSLTGKSWTTIVPPHVTNIAIDEFYVYGVGASDGAVYRAQRDGGSWTKIVPPHVTNVAIDESYVYGVGASDGAVYRAPKKRRQLDKHRLPSRD
jgi:hypothetical protein